MANRMRRILSLCLCGVCLPTPCLAQATGGVVESGRLEDIVVTAERRTANVQDIPLSVTALNQSQLASKAVARVEDLAYATPSLTVSDSGITQSVNIRGIGIATGEPAVVNGVATYLDGVFQPPILTTNLFYDIASVEVLRGPQGTLVGSNSTGGAIFIRSQNPDFKGVGGFAEGRYGSRDRIGGQAAVNLPLTENLAIRAAGIVEERDSPYKDSGPFKNKVGRLSEKAGRISLLWRSGAFQALAKAEWIDRKMGGFPYRPIPTTIFSAGRVGGIRDLAFNESTFRNEHAFMSALEMRYELPGGVVLRSQSGYGNRNFHYLTDTDATLLARQSTQNRGNALQYSQEVNVISPTNGAFNWILGGYYQRDEINVAVTNLNNGFPTKVGQLPNKDILGVFGQGGYKITPDLEFQLGVRYSHYKVKARGGGVFIGAGIPGFPPGGLFVASTEGDHADGRVTGKAALNWKVDEDNLIYAFVARGYKSGGSNSPTSEFAPETVLNYEIGWKTEQLDGKLRAQIDMFLNDYKGFQFSDLNRSTGQSGIVNFAKATIKGAEAQLQAKFGGLGLDANIAYVESKLPSITFVNTRLLPPGVNVPQCGPGGNPAGGTCFDYTPYVQTNGGGANLYSPKWTLGAGLEYQFGLGDRVTVTPRINYAYISGQYTYLGYSKQTDYLPARGLLSALVTVRTGDTLVEVYGTNLADKEYVSGQSGRNEFYGAPREFGVRVRQEF